MPGGPWQRAARTWALVSWATAARATATAWLCASFSPTSTSSGGSSSSAPSCAQAREFWLWLQLQRASVWETDSRLHPPSTPQAGPARRRQWCSTTGPAPAPLPCPAAACQRSWGPPARRGGRASCWRALGCPRRPAGPAWRARRPAGTAGPAERASAGSRVQALAGTALVFTQDPRTAQRLVSTRLKQQSAPSMLLCVQRCTCICSVQGLRDTGLIAPGVEGGRGALAS